MHTKKLLGSILLGACLFGATACHIVLPANHYSYDVKGQRVDVRLLDLGAMHTREYKPFYDAAFKDIGFALPSEAPTDVRDYYEVRDEHGNLITFGKTLTEVSNNLASRPKLPKGYKPAALPALAAPLAGLAIDFAMDYVKGALKEEATKYEMQFEGVAYIDKFWARESPVVNLDPETTLAKQLKQENLTLRRSIITQNYYGFEIVRTTTSHGAGDPAFKLVFGIAPSSDRQVFLLAPLLAKTNSARTKVLSRRWWTWVPIPYGWALDASDEVQTKVNVELTAIWRERQAEGFDQRFQQERLISFTFDLPTQRLSSDKTPLVVGDKLPLRVGGWFGSVPISFNAFNDPVGNGTGTLRVVVTEKDPSNAKQRLEQAAEAIEKHGDDLAKKATGGGEDLPD